MPSNSSNTLPSILAIETTTDTCSVAIHFDGYVQVEQTKRRPKVHAEQLVPMIQDVLSYTEFQVKDLDGIAVSSGPGSYTGLRIGVSTAKGLAFAHNIKLVSVASLSAMAFSSLPYISEGSPLIISRNSRKGEVYIASFKKTAQKSFEIMSGPDALLLENLTSHLPDEVLSHPRIGLAGEGSSLVLEHLPTEVAKNTETLPDTSVSPSASSVAYLGAISFEKGSFEDVTTYEPVYLKDFIPKLRATSVFDRLPF